MTPTELQSGEFPSVLPLYRSEMQQFPLISAVIQNRQRGRIFVDQRREPTSALVITNFGFMKHVGADDNDEFDLALMKLFAGNGTLGQAYLLWYTPPAGWQQKLDALNREFVKRRKRVRFRLEPNKAKYLGESQAHKSGFQLRSLDEELIKKTDRFGLNIGTRFWSSVDDFIANGLGICALSGNAVVSLCYAAAVVDGLAEIDVVTDQEYRGQGLGLLVAQEFIRMCLSRNIYPTWDCFEENTGSMRLAVKLGFTEVNRYPFYSFNVPLPIS